MNLLGSVELKFIRRSTFLFCVLTLAFIVGCSATVPVKAPNISALYRVPILQKQLPPLADKSRPLTQEPLSEQAQVAFQRLFGVNRTLALEAGRLPSFQNGIKEKEVLALTRFTELVQNATPEQKANLESLLSIGLKDSRRYSSPLEAIFWILEKDDYDRNNQVLLLPLEELLDKAWDFSDQTKWEDFDIVTERLNAPELVNYYERRRFIYNTEHSSRNVTPSYVFKRNTGTCTPITVFTVYCLQKGGYKASKINVQKLNVQQPSHGYGHVVCLFDVNGRKYILDNGRPDKFLRRGIIPLEQYEMYHDRLYARKGGIAKQKDPVLLLQDNYGLVLIYLIEEKSRITNIETICKDLGVSLFERNARKAIKNLVEFGFISKPVLYKKEGFKGFMYKINESLCERFKKERYNRPQNAAAKW